MFFLHFFLRKKTIFVFVWNFVCFCWFLYEKVVRNLKRFCLYSTHPNFSKTKNKWFWRKNTYFFIFSKFYEISLFFNKYVFFEKLYFFCFFSIFCVKLTKTRVFSVISFWSTSQNASTHCKIVNYYTNIAMLSSYCKPEPLFSQKIKKWKPQEQLNFKTLF